MSKNQPSNAIVVDTCTQRLQALKSYVEPKAQIAIDGVVHKASDVIEIYQTCLDTRAALATKRAETKAAISDRANAESTRRTADRALKAWVANQFGVASQQAIDFGFPPPKTATRTADSKALAVQKAKATRAARHTMGKKQKAQIKGTVVVSTAPAAPANNSAPGGVPAAQAAVVVQPPPQPLATPPTSTAVAQPAPANGAPASAPVLNGTASH